MQAIFCFLMLFSALEATQKEQQMIIAVGSTNKVKVQAVEETIKGYKALSSAKVLSFSVPSQIADQPLSLDEIIQGAKTRAKNAFSACPSCTYSFGIESGLFKAPGTQTGYFEACVCTIFDGQEYYSGLSCGFEIPQNILDLILEKKMDLNEACCEAGITSNKKLGENEGFVGILTKGRIDRKAYTKQCVTTALIQLENADLYSKKLSPALLNE